MGDRAHRDHEVPHWPRRMPLGAGSCSEKLGRRDSRPCDLLHWPRRMHLGAGRCREKKSRRDCLLHWPCNVQLVAKLDVGRQSWRQPEVACSLFSSQSGSYSRQEARKQSVKPCWSGPSDAKWAGASGLCAIMVQPLEWKINICGGSGQTRQPTRDTRTAMGSSWTHYATQ